MSYFPQPVGAGESEEEFAALAEKKRIEIAAKTTETTKEKQSLLKWGGIVAGVVLIAILSRK